MGRDESAKKTAEFESSTHHVYLLNDLIENLQFFGCLDNYKAEGGGGKRALWHEAFSGDDIFRLFAKHPEVLNVCNAYIARIERERISAGEKVPLISDLLLIDDKVFNLLYSIVVASRPFYADWAQQAYFQSDKVTDALRGLLEELQLLYKYDAQLRDALDRLSRLSDFKSARSHHLTDDVDGILDHYSCSAGFVQAVSYLVSIINTLRNVIAYQNRDEAVDEFQVEQKHQMQLKPQSLFFENAEKNIKRNLMKLPMFCGSIDTEHAQIALKDQPVGTFILRYSPSKSLFFVVANYFSAGKNRVELLNLPLSLNGSRNDFEMFVKNDVKGIRQFLRLKEEDKLQPLLKGDVLTIIDKHNEEMKKHLSLRRSDSDTE